MDNEKQEKLFSLLERIANSLEKLVDNENYNNFVEDVSFRKNDDVVSTECDFERERLIKKLENEFKKRNIELLSLPGKYSYDESFNNISYYIGSHYDEVLPILQKIKQSMQTGRKFQYSVKNSSQNAIMHMCQLCTRLHQSALLEEYNYTKSPTYLIKAKPSNQGLVQSFFSGEWYERYIIIMIEKILSSLNIKYNTRTAYSIFNNISIRMSNGNQAELDIVVFIEEDLYWIECKSGNYQFHVAKYNSMIKDLDFSQERSHLVVADLPKEVISSINGIYSNINIHNTKAFLEVFEKYVEKKYYSKEEEK